MTIFLVVGLSTSSLVISLYHLAALFAIKVWYLSCHLLCETIWFSFRLALSVFQYSTASLLSPSGLPSVHGLDLTRTDRLVRLSSWGMLAKYWILVSSEFDFFFPCYFFLFLIYNLFYSLSFSHKKALDDQLWTKFSLFSTQGHATSFSSALLPMPL